MNYKLINNINLKIGFVSKNDFIKRRDFVKKDSLLCKLGIVELNRTEVKSPFSGYIESIVKPGNFLDRGQVCATIIDLDPIKFIAEIPEIRIADVKVGQKVLIELITGEKIEGKLSFVSKSASPQTKTFRVESEISNPVGTIKDGVTSTITIQTDEILSHKISKEELCNAFKQNKVPNSFENDFYFNVKRLKNIQAK